MIVSLMLLMFGFPPVTSLDSVRTLYVDGNGEAASVMRTKLESLRDKYGIESCFALESREKADAIFVVTSEDHASGINTILAGVMTTSVSGTVESKDWQVLWPQTWKVGSPGFTPDGALKSGAGRVLEALYKSAGCEKNGRRRAQ